MKNQFPAVLLSLALAAPGVFAQSDAPSPEQAQSYSQPDESKRTEAYYNFTMGHLNEELYEITGSSEYATGAIEYYRKALALDPTASVITERLAETFAKSQRIRDAILEAQVTLKQDPDNLGAHRLLARIYVRTLGDLDAASPQKETLGLAIEEFRAILRIDPSDTESALWLARLYRFKNEHGKAEEVLQSILQRDPENGPALEQISQLLLDEGRATEAIALLEKAASGSMAPGILDLLGDAYSQTKDYPKSEEAYRKAVTAEPEEASHRRGLAQALLSQNKYEEAATQYKKLTEIDPDTAENYLRLSQVYRHLNKLDEAERALLIAKQRSPGNLEVIYNEALLYEAEGRYNDAAHLLADAIAGLKTQPQGQSGPNALAVLYEQLGRVYRESENYAAAVRIFEDMQKLGPEQQQRGELLLIETYRASREIDKAIAEAKKAVAATPEDRELQTTYAMLLGEKGQTDDAAKVLRGLLRNTGDDQEIFLDLAQVEERGRRYDAAERAATTAIQMARQPGEKSTAEFMLGAIYERQKKYDEAEEQFRKVLESDPHNAAALNYYGYMLADRGVRLEEATSLIQRAVKEEPANGAYLDSLGWAYFKQSRFGEAEECLRKAVERASHDPTILDHLGDLYAKLGQTQRAAELWEKAQAEWQRTLPADYEADKVAQVDQKLKAVKKHLAQKTNPPETAKPQ
jgi:tetratricopeptide (TPR) repeat protein